MKIHYDIDKFTSQRATVVTIGTFDGVHLGHAAILRRLTAMAARLDADSVVVTFEPHPRIAMGRDDGMGLLTTVEERALLLARYGVEHVVVVHFNEAFRRRSYDDFVCNTLVAQLGMRGMVVGYDHRFGRNNEGGYEQIKPLSVQYGFEVERVEQYQDMGDGVSSTAIRRLISEGNMRRAVEMLGHPYIFTGVRDMESTVVQNERKLLPPSGIYLADIRGCSVEVEVQGDRVRFVDGKCGEEIVSLIG